MIKIEDVEVMGMRKALNSMRNPLNSWAKGDSRYAVDEKPDGVQFSYFKIGDNDMKLCRNLIKAGSSDRKFMRMIHVQADVTAPFYWWKEYDTYKVGTVANSCSTMHTIHKRELTLDDFSHEHLTIGATEEVLIPLIDTLNNARSYYIQFDKYNEHSELWDEGITEKKDLWWQMIQLLPSSFNQMRTIDLDYETLLNIYFQRRNHKLDEWHTFCDWILTLPYMKEFIEAAEAGRKNNG